MRQVEEGVAHIDPSRGRVGAVSWQIGEGQGPAPLRGLRVGHAVCVVGRVALSGVMLPVLSLGMSCWGCGSTKEMRSFSVCPMAGAGSMGLNRGGQRMSVSQAREMACTRL